MTVEELREVVNRADNRADMYVVVDDVLVPIVDAGLDSDGDLIIHVEDIDADE